VSPQLAAKLEVFVSLFCGARDVVLREETFIRPDVLVGWWNAREKNTQSEDERCEEEAVQKSASKVFTFDTKKAADNGKRLSSWFPLR
jgi:hypothetical protein